MTFKGVSTKRSTTYSNLSGIWSIYHDGHFTLWPDEPTPDYCYCSVYNVNTESRVVAQHSCFYIETWTAVGSELSGLCVAVHGYYVAGVLGSRLVMFVFSAVLTSLLCQLNFSYVRIYQKSTTWKHMLQFNSRPGRGLNIWVTFFPAKVYSAFHPSGVGKMSTSIHGWPDLKRLPLAPIYASGPLGVNWSS